jgi:serine/threonine protein kinase
MGQSELAAQQRMQLEAILESFEDALRNASDGQLPDIGTHLLGLEGESRNYLEREMRSLLREMVRGNYIVLNPIESGGMGSVSKVRHLRLGKVMALKEIRAEALQLGDREEIVRRFLREIEACGRMDEHPNIVSYTDTGVNESGIPFLVMDYIDGEDLAKIVRRLGPLRIADAAQVIHDAAVGLAHAHDHGLVHRDVKPSNIMVSRHGAVKVLDFGLARVTNADRQLTALTTGKVMGTFDYMSPELCREITPDRRGDIYSLGCTLYFALAGRAPFEDVKSQFEKMNAHLHTALPALPRLDEAPELQTILQKMVAKQPADRYQDIHEVADALRPFCANSDLRSLVRAGKSRASSSDPLGAGILLRTDPRSDASRYATGSRARDQTAEYTAFRRTRVRRFSMTALVVVSGILLLASLLIADSWKRTQHRQELAKAIETMPGLNGRWWFDETPWLLPDVRQQLVISLADTDEETRQTALDAIHKNASAPAAYQKLFELADRFTREWPDDVKTHLATVETYDPEDSDADAFAQSLRSIATELDSPGRRESLTGVELHVRAVIYHHLEQLEAASRYYDAAADRYREEEQPTLRSLCLLDWGELLHDFRQPALAHSKFRQAWRELRNSLPPDEPLPPLFELYAKAMEADAHRRIGNMREAESLLLRVWQIASELPSAHPLRAFAHERRAWFHLDNWRLEEAQIDFQTALKIREAHDPENHRARHFIYWDQQGIGMSQMYDGEVEDARAVFQTLLKQIDVPPGEITIKQRRELLDRRPNLHERLADTSLFSGNGQSTENGADPATELDLAIATAEDEKFQLDGRKSILIRLHYKAAVVRALRGEIEMAQSHVNAAQTLEAQLPVKTSSDVDATRNERPPTYALTKELAIATLEWKSEDDDETKRGLERLANAVANASAGLPRDELLLLLYVGENLLNTQDLSAAARVKLAQEMRQLIRVQSFPGDNSSASPSNARIPGVFQRYLRISEQAGGKE